MEREREREKEREMERVIKKDVGSECARHIIHLNLHFHHLLCNVKHSGSHFHGIAHKPVSMAIHVFDNCTEQWNNQLCNYNESFSEDLEEQVQYLWQLV